MKEALSLAAPVIDACMITYPKEVIVVKRDRFWAVYLDSELLAVVVYKKGAVAIKQHLDQLYSHVIPHSS